MVYVFYVVQLLVLPMVPQLFRSLHMPVGVLLLAATGSAGQCAMHVLGFSEPR